MKYMGSKSRHAKHILPIILKDRKPNQWYVEPFVGGANVIDKVDGNRIGGDSNEYLIAMLKDIQSGYQFPLITKEEYKEIRRRPDDYPLELVGYAAICHSYNGKWFGGYAGKITTKDGIVRDYRKECERNVKKQELLGIRFFHCSYLDLELPPKSLIYCDPPYAKTTGYKDKFNHDEFWDWCREKHSEGHTIFVSEYNAPDDFTCVWEKQVNSSMTANTGSKKATEKLFTLTDKHYGE